MSISTIQNFYSNYFLKFQSFQFFLCFKFVTLESHTDGANNTTESNPKTGRNQWRWRTKLNFYTYARVQTHTHVRITMNSAYCRMSKRKSVKHARLYSCIGWCLCVLNETSACIVHKLNWISNSATNNCHCTSFSSLFLPVQHITQTSW